MMRFKTTITIFALAILMVAGAIGEAQDEIVITANNLTRLGSLGVSTSILDENDVDVISTEDGSYLAMLVTRVRPALPGERCIIPYPPPPPGTPCYIEERVLSIYEITTNSYTQICSKNYAGSGLYPSALKWVEHDEEPYVVVLEGLQLGFYGLNCQKVYLTELPVDFTYPYEINAYQDLDVAYIGINRDPIIVVAGGVYYESPPGVNNDNGLVVGVEWVSDAINPLSNLPGNFVATQRKILECEGIVTSVVSEGNYDNITSVVVCTKEIDNETVEDTVIVIKGTPENPFANIAVPNFIAYRSKSFCTKAEADANTIAQKVIEVLREYYEKNGIAPMMAYLANNPIDGVCRPELSLLDENGLLHTLSVFNDAPSGVDAIANSISGIRIEKLLDSQTKTYYAVTVAGQIGDEAVVEVLVLNENAEGVWRSFSWSGMTVDEIPSIIVSKVVKFKAGSKLKGMVMVASVDGDAPLTVQQLSSAPIGGPGTNDLIILELEICSSPIALAYLTKIDNGDEEKDTDKGLFEVSFGYVDPYECQPVACIAELVCQDGKSIAVEQDQLVEIKIEDDECKIENKDGKLEIKGQVKLVATCSNETGSSVAEALPEGLTADNDEQGEDDD